MVTVVTMDKPTNVINAVVNVHRFYIKFNIPFPYYMSQI